MSNTILKIILIENKIRILLIHCIIRKMHCEVSTVFFIWFSIFHSSKSCQSFRIHEYLKRAYTLDQHIDAEIKLQSINQKWIFDVFLNHTLIAVRKSIYFFSQINPSTLAGTFRFDNVVRFLFRLGILIVPILGF